MNTEQKLREALKSIRDTIVEADLHRGQNKGCQTCIAILRADEALALPATTDWHKEAPYNGGAFRNGAD